jgi:predicted protein tyrosine phosphatase
LVVHCFAGISRSTATSILPNRIDDRLNLRGELFRVLYDCEREEVM